MRKLLLVLILMNLFPLVNAYSFNFSVDNYKIIENIIEISTFSCSKYGNTTFEWREYTLNTTDYLYWAGIFVFAKEKCTFNSEVKIIDNDGITSHISYSTSGINGTTYVPLFDPDLYFHRYLGRGPYTLNITLKAVNCEFVVKKFVFITSKEHPRKLPLMLVPPSWCPRKEPAIRAFQFTNKTYWREFELNFTYIYEGSFSDPVVGWKEEPCPVLSLHNGSICLAESYCQCYESKSSLQPGMYRISLSLRDGNLSVKIFKDKLIFKKSVHVRHPLYLESIGGPCSGKIAGTVSFYGVEGPPSETFYTPEDDYGSFVFAIAVVIALIIAFRWRK